MSEQVPPASATPSPPDLAGQTMNGRPRERWGTRLGVILAVMGSAVGLGNFLRFPGLAAKYEGGAFMVPYFIALFLLGLPLAWAEWSMGRYGGAFGTSSTPGIYRAITGKRWASYFGVLGVIVPLIIYMYYVLIEAWCLGYAWFYLTGAMSEVGVEAVAAAEASGASVPDKTVFTNFFVDFAGMGADGSAFTGANSALMFLTICFVLNFSLIYLGVTKGIERFCLFAMPLLIACALVVLVRVLTLDGITGGLGFMWNPRGDAGFINSLFNGQMWLEATGQIFFSLSVGFGIIITYASYMKRNDDVALSGLTSAAGNEFCEVALGGLITIPSAYIFLGAAAVTAAAGSSFNLGFFTLPMVFELMPFGQVVGFAFFFLLFLAAVTSSLSMLQPVIALLEEGLGLARKASVALLGFITLIGAAFTLYFSQDALALDTMDFWVGTFCIYLVAMFQTILFGWVIGPKRGMAELQRGAEISIPNVVGFLLRWVSPAYLLIVFIFFTYGQITADSSNNRFLQIFQNTTVTMTMGFIAIVIILFLFLIGQSQKRWDAAGIGMAGQQPPTDNQAAREVQS